MKNFQAIESSYNHRTPNRLVVQIKVGILNTLDYSVRFLIILMYIKLVHNLIVPTWGDNIK